MQLVGLDIHKNRSSLCILDNDGRVVKEELIKGHWAAVLQRLGRSRGPGAASDTQNHFPVAELDLTDKIASSFLPRKQKSTLSCLIAQALLLIHFRNKLSAPRIRQATSRANATQLAQM